MLWSLALHLAVLAPASLKASILEMKSMSITKQSGESVEIICDLKQDINYIHWYRYQEGKTLQRILLFYFPSSKVFLDTGFSSEKYHAYKYTQRSCKLFLKNLQESDSAGGSVIRPEQPAYVLGHKGSSVTLRCLVHFTVSCVHWYRQQEGKAPERLLQLAMFKADLRWDSILKADKITALESQDGNSCTLSVLKLEKSDEGVYYCAELN